MSGTFYINDATIRRYSGFRGLETHIRELGITKCGVMLKYLDFFTTRRYLVRYINVGYEYTIDCATGTVYGIVRTAELTKTLPWIERCETKIGFLSCVLQCKSIIIDQYRIDVRKHTVYLTDHWWEHDVLPRIMAAFPSITRMIVHHAFYENRSSPTYGDHITYMDMGVGHNHATLIRAHALSLKHLRCRDMSVFCCVFPVLETVYVYDEFPVSAVPAWFPSIQYIYLSDGRLLESHLPEHL